MDLDQNSVMQDRYIKDSVHDYLNFSPRVSAFIDTKQFQRLRYIKQLGTSYYVWPGASHNRFEHCLGVAYLSRQLALHLKNNQPHLGITDRDVECVELAGLCHDLGHGPWSHVWDGIFMPRTLKGKKWKHEDGSEMMFNFLVTQNEILISEEDCIFIKALIAGDPKRCQTQEKPFLFEIVANRRNGIDVDKFDYIMRDSQMVGDKGNLSLTRLIQSARVIDDQICYDIKNANQIFELCYTRFSLHKRIYNHKTAKAIEHMIVDALLAADPYMHISDRVFNPSQFLYLTDDIMSRIESTEDPNLAEAHAILNRIRTRDLYKCVDYKVVDWEDLDLFREHLTPESIVKAAKSLPIGPPPVLISAGDDADIEYPASLETLEVNHVIVDFAQMHHGMQERNPLDFVKFYSKNKPNECANYQPGDMSTLMPKSFAEVLIRVYTRDARYYGIIQAGYRAVMQNITSRFLQVSGDDEVPTLTPPATEAPSTPKAHSRNSSFTFPPSSSTSLTKTFSNNNFTTVEFHHAPSSPAQNHRKPRSKRGREIAQGSDEEGAATTPLKKRRRP